MYRNSYTLKINSHNTPFFLLGVLWDTATIIGGMKLRKQITLILFSVILFTISACSSTPANVIQPTESDKPTETSSDKKIYKSSNGWSVQYPMTWDYESDDLLRETETEKFISFDTYDIPEEGIEKWLESKIQSSLAMNEANNTLLEDVTKATKDNLSVYKYAIESKVDARITELRFIIYVDNKHIYQFQSQNPSLTKDEFEEIVNTFSLEK